MKLFSRLAFLTVLIASHLVAQTPAHSPFDLKGERLGTTIQTWSQANPRLWNRRSEACDVHSQMTLAFRNFAFCVFTDEDLPWEKRSFAGEKVSGYITYFSGGRVVGLAYILSNPQDKGLTRKLTEKFGPTSGCEDDKKACFWVAGSNSLWFQWSGDGRKPQVTLIETKYIDKIASRDM